MPGLVPGIHVLLERVKEDVDGRDIGERSNAVLRTTMPGHDENGTRAEFAASFDPMPEPQPEEQETEADRRTANIALLVGAAILIGGGIWLVNALIDARQAEECMESGRRNCNPIEVPAR